MKEWKVILATLVIFGTGVVTGGLLVHLTSQKQGRPKLPPLIGSGPVQNQKDIRGLVHEQRYEYMRRLAHALELTPEQAGKVDKFLTDSQQRTKTLWEPMQGKLNEEVRKTLEQIRDVLSPDQRKKFDEMNKQQRPRKDAPPGTRPVVRTPSAQPGVPPPPDAPK